MSKTDEEIEQLAFEAVRREVYDNLMPGFAPSNVEESKNYRYCNGYFDGYRAAEAEAQKEIDQLECVIDDMRCDPEVRCRPISEIRRERDREILAMLRSHACAVANYYQIYEGYKHPRCVADWLESELRKAEGK